MAAFETNDVYSYVAGDATKAYSPAKCRLALRQMVFLYPNRFIVCDRVESTKAEYPKTFVLHTATEPEIRGGSGLRRTRGTPLARTLLPVNRPSKRSAPGRQSS